MVSIITTETFPNGLAASARIRNYAKCLAEIGLDVKVLCVNRCEDPKKPIGNDSPQGVLDGYSYHYLGNSTRKSSNAFVNKCHQLLDIIKLLGVLLSYNKKDTVIIYSYSVLLFKLITILSVLIHFKVFFELNEHPSIMFKGFTMDDDSERDLKRLKRKLDRVDGIICISPSLAGLLKKCGIAPAKIHIVNMVVDVQKFMGLTKDNSIEEYIGYCGAADNNKDGVDSLINAFSIIAKKHPNTRLYIMGPKRPDCKNEELVHELGLSQKVIFTGMISPDQLPRMLINAQVLALARPQSRQSDYGFPTKLGEYLCTGNPVVVTAVGDIPLFVKDEESAYLAQPDNISSIAMKLEEALSQKEKSRVIGENGQRVANEFFSYERVLSQLRNAMNL